MGDDQKESGQYDHRTAAGVMKPILIIGGGISGITSALELAEAGKEVILVEKSPWLGGNVGKMNNYFPKLCPPACGLEINYRRIRSNPRVGIRTLTEVVSIEGESGNFSVKMKIGPELVKDTCTACGECVDVCPVQRPDVFNAGMSKTKAIFLHHALAFPNKYTIDQQTCTGESCGQCLDVCQYDAIDLKAVNREENLYVHSIIIASGWRSYPAERIKEFNYQGSADILTNMEFERLLSSSGPFGGAIKRPSDGEIPSSVAFVQCAGSRDRNHLAYCSAVCCSASLKHALNVTESLPKATVSVFYIDLRVTGRNEDFLNRVEVEERIQLIKGKVGTIEVNEADGKIAVEAEDIKEFKKIRKEFDLVVLATGIMAEERIPGIKYNAEGFYSSEQIAGVFPVACSKRPMDVATSLKDATSAALKAMSIDS